MKKHDKYEENSIELNSLDLQNNYIIKKELKKSNDLKESLLEEDIEKQRENIQKKRNKINTTIYGNNIGIKFPKQIGKMRVLFYYREYPLIVIGPECKQII